VTAGRVVKGTNFIDLRDAGDPVEIARRYDEQGADEVTFLDITATSDTFPVDDFFAPAVEAFMLSRLLGGDDEASPNYQAAQAQFSAFQTLLGLKSGGDSAMAARRDIK